MRTAKILHKSVVLFSQVSNLSCLLTIVTKYGSIGKLGDLFYTRKFKAEQLFVQRLLFGHKQMLSCAGLSELFAIKRPLAIPCCHALPRVRELRPRPPENIGVLLVVFCTVLLFFALTNIFATRCKRNMTAKIMPIGSSGKFVSMLFSICHKRSRGAAWNRTMRSTL